MRALDASLSAKQEEIDAYWRKLFIPSFGLQAKTTHRIHKSGAESDDFSLPDPMGSEFDFPLPDNFDWYIGVFASLPLYEGDARYASIRKSEQELYQLKFQKEATRDRIEQRIRSALHQVE